MGVYYPQATLTLRVLWEDFDLKSDASLQQVYTLPILARRVSVNINDYTQADTFDAEIDFKNFPFDPRAIRSLGVEISMQDMGQIFSPNNNGISAIKMTEDNRVFMGFADEESISLDEDRRTVKIEGRDFTALLIDRKYTGGTLDTSRPLDVLITQLLAELKEVAKLKLDNRVGTELPVIGSFSPTATTNTKLGSHRSQGKDESYWEVITNLVARAGLICYIELDKLVISKPRVLYSPKQTLQFVYGRNIKSLEYKRQLGRKKNFNINVRSLNTQTKEVLLAEIPLEATDEWSKDTGIPNGKKIQIPVINSDGSLGEPKDAPIIGFRVPNITNKDHLIKVGQEIYEEISRQQLDGSFTTKDLHTVDGKKTCFDMFKLRNGTPVSIKLDQGDLKGLYDIVSSSPKRQEDARTQYLAERGYQRSVARALAKTLSNPQMNTPFYTKSVQFTIDQDTGVDIKVDFINFIELPERLKA